MASPTLSYMCGSLNKNLMSMYASMGRKYVSMGRKHKTRINVAFEVFSPLFSLATLWSLTQLCNISKSSHLSLTHNACLRIYFKDVSDETAGTSTSYCQTLRATRSREVGIYVEKKSIVWFPKQIKACSERRACFICRCGGSRALWLSLLNKKKAWLGLWES